jgi:hypothetical protein
VPSAPVRARGTRSSVPSNLAETKWSGSRYRCETRRRARSARRREPLSKVHAFCAALNHPARLWTRRASIADTFGRHDEPPSGGLAAEHPQVTAWVQAPAGSTAFPVRAWSGLQPGQEIFSDRHRVYLDRFR